jgi:hypothetical protein
MIVARAGMFLAIDGQRTLVTPPKVRLVLDLVVASLAIRIVVSSHVELRINVPVAAHCTVNPPTSIVMMNIVMNTG